MEQSPATPAGGISKVTWWRYLVAFAAIVRLLLVGKWTISAPKVGFPIWSMNGRIGYSLATIATRQKGDKWPSGGYVDPCARSIPARPENFFDFDTLTGEILPKQGLSSGRSDKAQRMIDNLHLNDGHHLQRRRQWLWMVSERLDGSSGDQDSSLKNTLSTLIDRSTEFSSITRVLLYERGYLYSYSG